jgi:hypothetical protein
VEAGAAPAGSAQNAATPAISKAPASILRAAERTPIGVEQKRRAAEHAPSIAMQRGNRKLHS